jgi:putative transposase
MSVTRFVPATVESVARVPRSTLPDGFFHVISRGLPAAGHVFRDDDDRRMFVDLLWRTVKAHEWECHALCVLGSHYHLVVETKRVRLSAGMERLNWSYARHFNERYESFGHVFAARFSARVIESEQYLYEACAYVVLNPVRAGLCKEASAWPWSYSTYGLTTA